MEVVEVVDGAGDVVEVDLEEVAACLVLEPHPAAVAIMASVATATTSPRTTGPLRRRRRWGCVERDGTDRFCPVGPPAFSSGARQREGPALPVRVEGEDVIHQGTMRGRDDDRGMSS